MQESFPPGAGGNLVFFLRAKKLASKPQQKGLERASLLGVGRNHSFGRVESLGSRVQEEGIEIASPL